MNLPIPILSVLIGAVILFFGRKLFWLCVAAVGFAAGVEVAPHLVHDPSAILSLSVAIVFDLSARCWRFFSRSRDRRCRFSRPAENWRLALVTAIPRPWLKLSRRHIYRRRHYRAILLLALFDWTADCSLRVVGRI